MTKENTWRALNDLKPIQSWKCRMGWHRWSNYAVKDRDHEYQMAYCFCACADCGLLRIEKPYSKTVK
jgi:hypothetical protein